VISMPLLTLFTAPKPFVDPHITVIQQNMLRNWLALGDQVEVVVVGDEPGIAEHCQALGVLHLPGVRCNEHGTPLISSIFALARLVNTSPFLAYANADILFLPELLPVLETVAEKKEHFLAVGQRWDVELTQAFDFSEGWDIKLKDLVQREGLLHGQTGSDYFVYPRACFQEIPDFAVGRAGWDNWMIYKARWEHWPVIDVSPSVMVVHQNHDYRHLPGGAKHYQLPETHRNVQIGGGRRTIFTLEDVTHIVEDDEVKRKTLDWGSFWREVENFPFTGLRSRRLGWLSFALFHPIKAYQEVRYWLAANLNRG
jgi:hypothetical protein